MIDGKKKTSRSRRLITEIIVEIEWVGKLDLENGASGVKRLTASRKGFG
jgi:hypothetical protein